MAAPPHEVSIDGDYGGCSVVCSSAVSHGKCLEAGGGQWLANDTHNLSSGLFYWHRFCSILAEMAPCERHEGDVIWRAQVVARRWWDKVCLKTMIQWKYPSVTWRRWSWKTDEVIYCAGEQFVQLYVLKFQVKRFLLSLLKRYDSIFRFNCEFIPP